MECWINGFEGRYKITTNGDVISVRTNRPMYLNTDKDGYKLVGLCTNGKRKYYKVHRLVAGHFIPNPNNKPDVNHKNGDKDKNDSDNLEWTTKSENMLHSCRVLNNKCGSKSKAIQAYDKDGNVIGIFESISEASREFDISRKSIISSMRLDVYVKHMKFSKCD